MSTSRHDLAKTLCQTADMTLLTLCHAGALPLRLRSALPLSIKSQLTVKNSCSLQTSYHDSTKQKLHTGHQAYGYTVEKSH